MYFFLFFLSICPFYKWVYIDLPHDMLLVLCYILVILKNTLANMGTIMTCWVNFLSFIGYASLGWLNHIGILVASYCSLWWLYQFTLPLTVHRGFSSALIPIHIFLSFFDTRYSNCGEIGTHCSFTHVLYFQDGWCYCATFHVLLIYLYFFFIQCICTLFKCIS